MSMKIRCFCLTYSIFQQATEKFSKLVLKRSWQQKMTAGFNFCQIDWSCNVGEFSRLERLQQRHNSQRKRVKYNQYQMKQPSQWEIKQWAEKCQTGRIGSPSLRKDLEEFGPANAENQPGKNISQQADSEFGVSQIDMSEMNEDYVCRSRRKIKLEVSHDKIRKINERSGRYLRSTNNSHKKYICVARKLLFKHMYERERHQFEKTYEKYRNSRTFFFIILSHVKLNLPAAKKREFCRDFIETMMCKIEVYRKEIQLVDNSNFKTFRHDQIADIEFALQAFNLYFEDHVDQAIELIYKKGKESVLKKNQFQSALSTVIDVEKSLMNPKRRIGKKESKAENEGSPASKARQSSDQVVEIEVKPLQQGVYIPTKDELIPLRQEAWEEEIKNIYCEGDRTQMFPLLGSTGPYFSGYSMAMRPDLSSGLFHPCFQPVVPYEVPYNFNYYPVMQTMDPIKYMLSNYTPPPSIFLYSEGSGERDRPRQVEGQEKTDSRPPQSQQSENQPRKPANDLSL